MVQAGLLVLVAVLGLPPAPVMEHQGATPSCYREQNDVVCETRLGDVFVLQYRRGSALLSERALWKRQLARYAVAFPPMKFKIHLGTVSLVKGQTPTDRAMVREARLGHALAILEAAKIARQNLLVEPADDDYERFREATDQVFIQPWPDRERHAGHPEVPILRPEVVRPSLFFAPGSDVLAYEPSGRDVIQQVTVTRLVKRQVRYVATDERWPCAVTSDMEQPGIRIVPSTTTTVTERVVGGECVLRSDADAGR